MDSIGETLMSLLTVAWLLPLVGFLIEIYALCWTHRLSKTPAHLAVGCIAAGFVCSLSALLYWGTATDWAALSPAEHGGEHHAALDPQPHGHELAVHSVSFQAAADAQPADALAPAVADPQPAAEPHGHAPAADDGHHDEHHAKVGVYGGRFYELATFGPLTIALDWYIDSLTLVMFTMVTFIATCIHIFAIGYMSEELTEDYQDHQVHLPGGHHFHRPGRFYRFFAFLSLFCFSMLGLVLAGNIFQVFIFWELVGVCSYLLIGFYVERHSASTAANKAFIMNRVGDFGFLIGLMIVWTSLGTFQFYDTQSEAGVEQAGLFSQIRTPDGQLDVTEDGKTVILQAGHEHEVVEGVERVRLRTMPYWLLVTAGLGVFAGCIGKSAQFPLQTWLPDAMEGPTPVSALVHSATMVAAGVYLAGRFYPMFTPEVLLTIAYIGCITLFIAATIALVATDIKRVLAYSTISQLGYMMLGIGVGGWAAGLFHLITHAFFKSLMFLCSGSVIAGCHHEQDMQKMGGLRTKMPVTAYTMLVGVIAIAGLAIPGTAIAFSGFHSKDAIVATALAYSQLNSKHILLFVTPLVTAGITSFYMFRLWFMTFTGTPRDEHVHEHAHENPAVMVAPLVVLAVLAAGCAIGGEAGPLFRLLAFSEPVPAHETIVSHRTVNLSLPSHGDVGKVHGTAGGLALLAAFVGMGVAFVLYCRPVIDPADIKRQAGVVYDFLVDKWRFDSLYDAMFVRPVHIVGRWCQGFDTNVLDRLLNGSATFTVSAAHWDRWFDETFVDGLVNLVGRVTNAFGQSLQVVQTGRLRQYVMWIAVSVVVLFATLFTALSNL